jgi:hypothetical protein
MSKRSELHRALAARWGTPQNVCRRLRIDPRLLGLDSAENVSTGMPSLPAAAELHNMLATKLENDPEIARIFELIEELSDERREAGDNIPEKVESMPRENLSAGGDEDDDPRLEPFSDHLRDKGMSEDEIDHAMRLARDHLKRKQANGFDRIPASAISGGMGGHLSRRGKGNAELRQMREHMDRISAMNGHVPCFFSGNREIFQKNREAIEHERAITERD